jgi:hypothetical protein
MTPDAFEALLTRRDELQRQHELACAVLEEEGCGKYATRNYQKVARLYDELTAVQKQIDDELAAERAKETTP